MLRPQYRLIVVRDIAADAAEGRTSAIEQAATKVAEAIGYEVVICAAQDLTPVRLEVEVWNDTPDSPAEPDWSGPLTFTIESPTGQLLAGDTFGNVVDGIDPPAGPGRYAVTVHHRGRAQAATIAAEITAALGNGDSSAADTLAERGSGTESYLLRMWRPK